MEHFNEEEIADALQVISSCICRCEKMQPKFTEGTSQCSLLKNRIKALYISMTLIKREDTIIVYTGEDLAEALLPVYSIIHKTEKAQSKYEKGTVPFRRFEPMVKAMHIAKAFLEHEMIQ